MSVRSDARACLIKAIHDRQNLDVTPEQLNVLRPSDIGVQDGFAWHVILKAAASCMRDKGHMLVEPEQSEALRLVVKPLIESQLYLETLATQALARPKLPAALRPFVVAGGIAVAVGTLAFAVRRLELGQRR